MIQNQTKAKHNTEGCQQQIDITFSKIQQSSIRLGFTNNYFSSVNPNKFNNKMKCKSICRSNRNQKHFQFERFKLKKNESIQKMKTTSQRQYNQDIKYSSIIKNIQTQQDEKYKTFRKQRFTVNPNITKDQFYIKVMRPIVMFKSNDKNNKSNAEKKNSNSSRSGVSQQRSRTDSHVSKNSMNSKIKSNKSIKIENPRILNILNQLNFVQQYTDNQMIISRLMNFLEVHNMPLPTQKAKYNIRVYKQDYKKIFQDRYGRDRVTNYINLQYITQFSQIKQILQDIQKYTHQEIMLLVFIIIDSDRDGLITANDLISLNNNKLSTNLLIQNDISIITDYIRKRKNQGDYVFDGISHGQIIKQDPLSVTRFRIHSYQRRKRQAYGQRTRTKSLITKNIRDHLFIFKEETPENKKSNFRLDLKNILNFSKTIQQRTSMHKFSINFQRFCQIFSTIPHIFYDVLFVLAGLKVPGFYYLDIDWKIFKPQNINQHIITQPQSIYQSSLKKLSQQKQLKNKLKPIKW